jgi:hypothetical protein
LVHKEKIDSVSLLYIMIRRYGLLAIINKLLCSILITHQNKKEY